MTPYFVADVGNSRIKCGFCRDRSLHPFTLDDAFLSESKLLTNLIEQSGAPRDDVLNWPWTVAMVNPEAGDRFVTGLRQLGFRVRVLSHAADVPIAIKVDRPESVGIDRLLSAAYAARRLAIGMAAAVISAGTAVTIDFVDSEGSFRGGVILPGFRLMARSLHEGTALLPLVEPIDADALAPAQSTGSAISAGVCSAISGAIDRVVEQYRSIDPKLSVFLTGGDAERVRTRHCKPVVVPMLTLQGVALVAGGTS